MCHVCTSVALHRFTILAWKKVSVAHAILWQNENRQIITVWLRYTAIVLNIDAGIPGPIELINRLREQGFNYPSIKILDTDS